MRSDLIQKLLNIIIMETIQKEDTYISTCGIYGKRNDNGMFDHNGMSWNVFIKSIDYNTIYGAQKLEGRMRLENFISLSYFRDTLQLYCSLVLFYDCANHLFTKLVQSVWIVWYNLYL